MSGGFIKEDVRVSSVTHTIAQVTLIIALFAFLSKLAGFLREILVGKYFGVSAQTDAFLIALAIPTTIMWVISNSITVLLIPTYLEKKEKGNQFFFEIFIITSLILIIIGFLIFVFAPHLVNVFAYGFDEYRFSLAVKYTRFLIPASIATVLIGLFTGVHYAKRRFLFVNIMTFLGNSIIVVSLFLYAQVWGINSWLIGQLACSIIICLSLFVFLVYKERLFHSVSFKINWSQTGGFFGLIIPLVISSSLLMLNQVVDRMVGSTLSVGTIAVLNFSQKTINIPVYIIVIPMVTAIYPTFSSFAIDSREKIAPLLRKAISVAWVMLIPLAVLFFCFSVPIVRLIFERGAFSSADTQVTAFTMSLYALGLMVYGANSLIVNAYYCIKNIKTPLIISVIILIMNFIGNVVFSHYWGVAGIALSTAVASFAGLLLYYIFLPKEFKETSSLLQDLGKIILSAVPVLVGGILFKEIVISQAGFVSTIVALFAVMAILISIYLVIGYYLRIEGLYIVLRYVNSLWLKLRRKGI